MNMKLFPMVLLGVLLSGRGASAQEPSPDLKSALAPLGRLAGTWEKRSTIYKSEWSPEEQAKTGTHSCQWILNDRHLQETGRDSDGTAYMSVYSYDAEAKAYCVSVFRSNGSTWQMSGKWDAKSSTFTWSQELADGITLTALYRLVSPDEFKFSYIAKMGDDKVYYRVEGTGKRVEASKK
jgi:Protein of unknown function (DUF1579)